MPERNYTQVRGAGDPAGAAHSPNEGRELWNASIDDLDARAAALEDNPSEAEVPIGGSPTDGQTLRYDTASGLYLPVDPTTGETGGITEADADARYVRIKGDPEEGSYFAWSEADGMLVPAAAPSGGDSVSGPAWMSQSGAGSLFGAHGDGDPLRLSDMLSPALATMPTLANYGTTTARCVRFRLPESLSLAAIRMLGASTYGYALNFAIYPAQPGADLLWRGAGPNTNAGVWASITLEASVNLQANTDYYLCAAATFSQASASVYHLQPPLSGGQYGTDAAPLGGRVLGFASQVLIPCSAGAFPATLPGVASSTVAGPIAFLEGSAS